MSINRKLQLYNGMCLIHLQLRLGNGIVYPVVNVKFLYFLFPDTVTAHIGLVRQKQGVEVVYLTDLVMESLTDDTVRKELLTQFLAESGVEDVRAQRALEEYFSELSDREMVAAMMAGVRKSQLKAGAARLGDYLTAAEDDYPFAVDLMPNLYFTRDPFATIGTGVSIHKMHTATRNRETLFGKFIFEHHPLYKNAPRWYDRITEFS